MKHTQAQARRIPTLQERWGASASGLFVNVKPSLVIQPAPQCFSMVYIITITSPRNLWGPLAQEF